MLEKIGKRSLKNGSNYIGEVEVLDTDTNKHYYVVTQLGDLLYATFESSYIDSIKNPELPKPNMIEGEPYLFFDFWEDRPGNTIYREFYVEAYNEASAVKSRNTITKKYARMKKPSGELKYEVISKDTMDTFACGPLGTIYEIKVRLLEDNTEIYVSLDTSFEMIYGISKNSIIKAFSDGDMKECDFIEEINGTQKIKKSKYYDLYYLVEQFYDGIIK